ncbi:hypothetical protein ACMD2_23138, partial [Ananas comosus]
DFLAGYAHGDRSLL